MVKYRNRVTGLEVESDRQLGYPYQREHTEENCWCEPATEHVCHCGRVFATANGLAQHQRMSH